MNMNKIRNTNVILLITVVNIYFATRKGIDII